MMVGDKRKYNVCLVTLKTEEKDGWPTDVLTGDAAAFRGVKTVGDAQNSAEVAKAIQNAIDITNANAVSRAQKIQYYRLLDQDFSVNGGHLTATLKLKRSVCAKMYADTIESMYKR